MFFKQYYLDCLAHASYLIGDEEAGVAVVVDPQRDVDQYLQDAALKNLRIEHVVLTHFHADFISGHLELKERAGAKIRLGAQAQAEYDFQPVEDGEVLNLGQVRLQFLETPGHTPESICILLFDEPANTVKPRAVLTGDTLFIGDVGRPDLMASMGISAEELARMLYGSLQGKILTLPDETLVYPAHGAGSMCGKNLSKERVSTIGDQRRFNYALKPMSADEFVRLVTADQQEQPAYFGYDAALNRKNRSTLEEALDKALQPLSLDELMRAHNSGAQLLDVREPTDYASAHLLGSTNVGLQGQFATWCGTLLQGKKPIVIVAEPGRESEAATRLGRIGFDNVVGYLHGGMEVLDSRPDLIRHTRQITAQVLWERLSSAEPPHVLDVRTDDEWDEKHVVGSIHIPLAQLPRRIQEVPRNSEFVVHCAHGYRSSVAASLLEQHGFTNFCELIGGYLAWELTSAPQ